MNFLTVPKLAERLGLSPSSVLDWIKRGHIGEPSVMPDTGKRGYSLEAADRIEAWYRQRVLDHKTRGPGALARRAAALAITEADSGEADSTP